MYGREYGTQHTLCKKKRNYLFNAYIKTRCITDEKYISMKIHNNKTERSPVEVNAQRSAGKRKESLKKQQNAEVGEGRYTCQEQHLKKKLQLIVHCYLYACHFTNFEAKGATYNGCWDGSQITAPDVEHLDTVSQQKCFYDLKHWEVNTLLSKHQQHIPVTVSPTKHTIIQMSIITGLY